MSEFTTRKINDRAGTGAPNFTYGLNSGGSDSGLIGKAYTSSGTEPSSPANGDLWYDSDNDKLYYYVAGEFKQITHTNADNHLWGGDRGIYAGAGNAATNYIEYIDITTSGNGTDFGDLTQNGANLGSVSNKTRIVFCGFQNNSIEYVTSATTGNATDFGDLTSSQRHTAGCSNGTRGLFMMDGTTTTIDYITIATTGNAQDFGDMTQHNGAADGSASGMDATYGLWAGGRISGSSTTNISYVTTATLGNSSDFGDLTLARGFFLTQIADTTRSCFAGGFASNVNDTIDYVTTATPSNATDFGDMTGSFARTGGTNNSTTGVIMGGWNGTFGGGYQNQIQQFTIQTTANATDFGDMTAQRHEVGACSGNAS